MVHEELEDSNITPVNSSETPIEAGCSRTPSRTYTTSSRKVPASKRMLTEQREIIDKICGTLTEKDKSDEFDTIGENVAHKFRRLNEEQRLYAEHLINKTLFYAIQNRLTSESDIVLSQSVNENVYNVSYSSYLNNHQIPVPNQPCVFERQYQPPVQDVQSELTELISFKK